MSIKKAIFIYTDDRGRPVLRKIRGESTNKGGKDFHVEAARYRNDRLYWKPGKGIVEKLQPEWHSKVIYNLPVVLDALRAGEPAWITEGERESDVLVMVGRVAATTVHQGIERMTPEQAKWFVRGDSTINILMDNDDAGAYGAWARYLALTEAGVGSDRLRLWRPASGFKDVSEAALSVGLRDAVVRAARGPTRKAAIRYGPIAPPATHTAANPPQRRGRGSAMHPRACRSSEETPAIHRRGRFLTEPVRTDI